jgi:hypothetical protein
VGFIFTIHFFNTHFRPDRFPMDTVIFTGRIPLEEFKVERPDEYERLVAAGELDRYIVDQGNGVVERTGKVFGTLALCCGLSLILLIVYAMLFGYQ